MTVGPFVKNRILDLSYAAAYRLGMIHKGTAHVRVIAINSYPISTKGIQLTGDDQGLYYIQVNTIDDQQKAKTMPIATHHQ